MFVPFTELFFLFVFFFFNDTATTEIYTLSLHDALPISSRPMDVAGPGFGQRVAGFKLRSEEHTSELQSPVHLVCRLLLEKKKQSNIRSKPLKKIITNQMQQSNNKA